MQAANILIELGHRLVENELTWGNSGNISTRIESSEFIITASSTELDTACLSQLGVTPYFLSLTGPTP